MRRYQIMSKSTKMPWWMWSQCTIYLTRGAACLTLKIRSSAFGSWMHAIMGATLCTSPLSKGSIDLVNAPKRHSHPPWLAAMICAPLLAAERPIKRHAERSQLVSDQVPTCCIAEVASIQRRLPLVELQSQKFYVFYFVVFRIYLHVPRS